MFEIDEEIEVSDHDDFSNSKLVYFMYDTRVSKRVSTTSFPIRALLKSGQSCCFMYARKIPAEVQPIGVPLFKFNETIEASNGAAFLYDEVATVKFMCDTSISEYCTSSYQKKYSDDGHILCMFRSGELRRFKFARKKQVMVTVRMKCKQSNGWLEYDVSEEVAALILGGNKN
jgi:hypothetical protein